MLRDDRALLSIITLNYNQTTVTCQFLESLKKLKYRNFEVLVCDMASSVDPTTEIESGNYPNTRILLSKKNLGFAAGNNWGMQHAKGDFFFIVNNDTEVTEDLLDKLLQPFAVNGSIGVTCPKIRYFDPSNLIQYAGFNPMSPYTGRTTTIGEKEIDQGQYDASRSTFGAHGCAMLVKREVAERTGKFPERFFLYYEEWDWSSRILKAGYIIWYTGDALIYHKESVSVGKNNPMKVFYHTRNRIMYMRRNTNWRQLIVFTLFFTFISIPKSVIGFVTNGQFTQLKYFLKGILWNLYSSSDSVV
jgi:GT2 family glycosyltransferase